MSFSWEDIWRLVKRWWWLAIIGMVVAGGTSYYFASKKPNIYAARTRLMVGSSIRSLQPSSSDFGLGTTLAQAYGEMARQRPVAQAVVDQLKLPIGWWDLAGRVRTWVIPSAQLLQITVLDTNPELAAALANAVAAELIRQSPVSSQEGVDRGFILQELSDTQANIQETQTQIDELWDSIISLTSATELAEAQTRLDQLEQLRLTYRSAYVELANLLNTQSPNTLTVVEPASPPTVPIAPNPKKEALMAAVAGLALAIGAILLLEFADDTLRIQDTGAESLMGLPILGVVARMPNHRCDPRSPAAEMIRQLRTKVILASPSGRTKSLLITSPLPKVGKTVLTGNLGIALAAGGARVVLVDADLRAPSLHEWFDQPNLSGLTDLLTVDKAQCEVLLPQVLREADVPGLSFISAGRPPLDPSIMLTSPRMPDLLALLSERCDFVLFDSPPVEVAPDATILATLAEGTLIVINPGRTGRKVTRRTKEKLMSREDTHVIGFALNGVPLRQYAYNYNYRYAPRDALTPPGGILARLRHRLRPSQILASLPVIGRPPAPDLVSLSYAANTLGVRHDTVKRWCQEGRLPGIKKWWRWWVAEDELQDILKGREPTIIPPDLEVADSSNGREKPVWMPTADSSSHSEPTKESLGKTSTA
jgi:capsular exopolysaccharide synthesis family protein